MVRAVRLRGQARARAALLAFAIVTAPAVSLSPIPASAAPTLGAVALAAPEEGLQRVGACIAGGGAGDILLLLDRSGSLKDTDPTAARVTAAQYLVRQLARFSESTGSTLSLAIAGFDAKYERTMDWTALTPESAAQIEGELESFRDRSSGVDTDYWNALSGARADLTERAAGSGGERCALAIWFTDGEFAVRPRSELDNTSRLDDPKRYDETNSLQSSSDTARAVKAGVQDLCRDGGVADQIRSNDITIVGIGLSGAEPPDFSLMKRISTGEGESCGVLTTPAPGVFYEAASIDDLFFTLSQVATPGQPPVDQEAGVCVDKVCPSGTHKFVLDASIGEVNALGGSDGDGDELVLTSPSGETHTLERADGVKRFGMAGADVEWRWVSDRSVSVDLRRTSDAEWEGPWRLTFIGNDATATSRSSLHLTGDIVPVWPSADEVVFRAEETDLPVIFGVEHLDGSAIDPESLSPETKLSAALLVPNGPAIPIATDSATQDIVAPHTVTLSGVAPGVAAMRLTLDVTTRAWKGQPGTRLEPQVRDYPVNILPPPGFPVLPNTIDFGTTEASEPVSREVAIEGDGCVWLDSVEEPLTLPEGATGAMVSSSANDSGSCVSDTVTLQLSPEGVGNGLLSGTLIMMTRSDDAGVEPVPVRVKYTLSMARPIDTGTLLWVLALVTFLGVLIPLALLYLVKFLTAKILGNQIQAGAVLGQVNESHSFLSEPIALAPHQMPVVSLSGGARNVAVGPATLAAKMGWAITEPGYILVTQPSTPATGRHGARHKGRARLPLAIAGTWCVGLDASKPHSGDVTVLFFTVPGAPGWEAQVEQARSEVPELVRTLRASLPDEESIDSSEQQTDPWGSSASSSGAPERGWGSSGGNAIPPPQPPDNSSPGSGW